MKIELYRDSSKDWRWRLRARNGRIVAESGEGYNRRYGRAKSLSSVIVAFQLGKFQIVEVTE